MANPKKAASSASAPTSAPASVGAPPSDAISPLSDLAAAMAEDESDETAEKPAFHMSTEASFGESVVSALSALAKEGIVPEVVLDKEAHKLAALPHVSIASTSDERGKRLDSVIETLRTMHTNDRPWLVEVSFDDAAESASNKMDREVRLGEEVTDLKNKVAALLDDLDAANARVERYKGEATEAHAKLSAAYEQIKLMDGTLSALDAENNALRNGSAPATVKPTPAVKPVSVPPDFDLLTWTGPGVYEGLCFKLTGESLPRARGAMTGWFPKSMARKFPAAFVKAA